MITAIDTNILVSLWKGEDKTSALAAAALDSAKADGGLVICGAVFAELLAYPKRTESFIYEFCSDTGIAFDWRMDSSIWVAAGRSFQAYTIRRKKQQTDTPRRILTDFIIGAHAAENGYRLLTFNERIFKTAFPKLKLLNG